MKTDPTTNPDPTEHRILSGTDMNILRNLVYHYGMHQTIECLSMIQHEFVSRAQHCNAPNYHAQIEVGSILFQAGGLIGQRLLSAERAVGAIARARGTEGGGL